MTKCLIALTGEKTIKENGWGTLLNSGLGYCWGDAIVP